MRSRRSALVSRGRSRSRSPRSRSLRARQRLAALQAVALPALPRWQGAFVRTPAPGQDRARRHRRQPVRGHTAGFARTGALACARSSGLCLPVPAEARAAHLPEALRAHMCAHASNKHNGVPRMRHLQLSRGDDAFDRVSPRARPGRGERGAMGAHRPRRSPRSRGERERSRRRRSPPSSSSSSRRFL